MLCSLYKTQPIQGKESSRRLIEIIRDSRLNNGKYYKDTKSLDYLAIREIQLLNLGSDNTACIQ